MGLLNWLKSIFSSDDDFSPLVKNELQYILSLDISFMQLIRKLKFIYLIIEIIQKKLQYFLFLVKRNLFSSRYFIKKTKC